MKSRILAVLFAVVLTAGTLAGCGSSKKADDTKAETTDEKSEDKASSDEDTKDVNVASEEEAEEAGFSDGTDTDGATVENTVLDTSQELTGIPMRISASVIMGTLKWNSMQIQHRSLLPIS